MRRRPYDRKPPTHSRPFLAAVALAVLAACDAGDPADPGHDHDTSGGCGHVDGLRGCLLVDSHSLDTLVTQRESVVSGRVEIQERSLAHGIRVLFLDHRLAAFALAETCTVNSLRWSVADTNLAQVSQDPGVRFYINVYGKRVGTTMMRLQLVHEDHVHYTSGDLPIGVTPVP